jgi:hypothetical protein
MFYGHSLLYRIKLYLIHFACFVFIYQSNIHMYQFFLRRTPSLLFFLVSQLQTKRHIFPLQHIPVLVKPSHICICETKCLRSG